jgi:rubredoxin
MLSPVIGYRRAGDRESHVCAPSPEGRQAWLEIPQNVVCRRCTVVSLLKTAATPETHQDLLALAETWRRLAAELESDQALLRTICELEVGYGKPYEVLPAALHIRSSA